MTFDRTLADEAYALADENPAALTDEHIEQMRLCGNPASADFAKGMRAKALAKRAVDAQNAEAAARPDPPAAEPSVHPGLVLLKRLCEEDNDKNLTEIVSDVAKAHPDTPVPIAIVSVLFKFVMQINERNKERNSKIAALEDRIGSAADSKRVIELQERVTQLEARPAALRYCGVWDRERDYQTDEAVTHGGGLWIARMDSRGVKPGDGVSWQLSVKGR